MKLLSWNILQGGGRRTDGVLETLTAHAPDVVCLQEYRRGNRKITDHLKTTGLRYIYEGEGGPSDNTLLIAAKAPVEAGPFLEGSTHILEAETSGHTILPLHFPQKAEQVPLFKALLEDSPSLLPLSALMVGDLNCGIPFVDSSEKTFVNTAYFQALLDAGWVDLYRRHNGPDARDFTWFSPRTGRGFRYDHALASPTFADHVTACTYDHTPREAGFSDHSALILTLKA